MVKIIFLIFFILPLGGMGQTVVIANKTKDASYVGADSRVIKMIDDMLTGKTDTILGTFCKIKMYGKFYVAAVHNFAAESFAFAEDASLKSKTFEK